MTLIPMGNADKSRFLYNGNQIILKKSVKSAFTERICVIRVLMLYLLINKNSRILDFNNTKKGRYISISAFLLIKQLILVSFFNLVHFFTSID